jgi:membrane protein YqaA with SNARE-associated domain
LLERLTNFLVELGPWAILLVSFIDSAGIPMTVGLDVLVILFSAKQPALAPLWVSLAVLGSTAGNITLFYLARKGGERYLKKEEAPLGYRRRFRQWFNRYGLVTVFIPALIPIPMPMKFFVVCSGVLGIRFFYFLFTVVIARILRYSGEAALGVQMGEHSTRFISDHRWEFGVAATLLAICLYLLVRVSERWRSSAG